MNTLPSAEKAALSEPSLVVTIVFNIASIGAMWLLGGLAGGIFELAVLIFANIWWGTIIVTKFFTKIFGKGIKSVLRAMIFRFISKKGDWRDELSALKTMSSEEVDVLALGLMRQASWTMWVTPLLISFAAGGVLCVWRIFGETPIAFGGVGVILSASIVIGIVGCILARRGKIAPLLGSDSEA